MISSKVETERKALNLTQEELGSRVGVSRQTIIAIERGNYSPSLELAFKLSKTLKKPVESLFSHSLK